jgi:hypothetical protein
MIDEKNQGDSSAGEVDTSSLKSIDKEELLREISKVVNGAITQRLNTFESKFDAKWQERLNAQDEAPKGPGRPAKEKDISPEVLALQKKLEAMEQKEAKLVQEQRDSSLRKSLTDQLTKAGIDQRYMKAALAMLIDSDKLVGYTSESYAQNPDKIVFRTQDGETELVDGLRDWIRSDEGKGFVAPKGAQGSGDKNYSLGNKKLTSEDQQKAGLIQALMTARNG